MESMTYLKFQNNDKKRGWGVDANQSGPIVSAYRKASINSVNPKKEIVLNRS